MVALLALFLAAPLTPQQGPMFLAMCEAWEAGQHQRIPNADAAAGAICFAYVQGFVDAASAYEGVQRLAQKAIGATQAHMACYVPGTEYHEYVRAVLKYLHAHPSEVQRQTRDELVLEALAQAFPCGGSNGRSAR